MIEQIELNLSTGDDTTNDIVTVNNGGMSLTDKLKAFTSTTGSEGYADMIFDNLIHYIKDSDHASFENAYLDEGFRSPVNIQIMNKGEYRLFSRPYPNSVYLFTDIRTVVFVLPKFCSGEILNMSFFEILSNKDMMYKITSVQYDKDDISGDYYHTRLNIECKNLSENFETEFSVNLYKDKEDNNE